MKFTFEEVAPIYKKAIQEINRLNTEIEKFKSGERLSTFDDAETMGYLTYEANLLRQQSTVDNFRINELSVKVKELKKDRDILNAFLKTTGKEGVDLCKENIKLRNENIELHCKISQLELFSGIDIPIAPDKTAMHNCVTVYTMTSKAKGATREQFIDNNWSNSLLVAYGYMTILYRSN